MNNWSSYCGLADAKIRASDKDLPVQKKPKMGQNKPKMGENHQNKPKMGEKCRHCHYFMEFNTTIDEHFCRKAAQYVGPNQHCNICDMDFESTPKTFRHIMKDHFDVALGCEDGNERWVFKKSIHF